MTECGARRTKEDSTEQKRSRDVDRKKVKNKTTTMQAVKRRRKHIKTKEWRGSDRKQNKDFVQPEK